MKASPLPRETANLSESVHQQLGMYALAAGAAGVGMLALTQPSEAKIVYTSANTPIRTTLNLDLNHDGTPDFEFCLFTSTGGSQSQCKRTARSGQDGEEKRPSPFGDTLFVLPANAQKQYNRILGNSTFRERPAAAALPAGFSIGPKRKFAGGNAYHIMATWGSASGQQYYGGPWKDALHRYLGLKFVIKGKIHYGWARLNVTAANNIRATLTGYAYETIPNKSIIAGQTKGTDDSNVKEPDAALASPVPDTPHPPTLAALALGAPGLSIWRREDSVAATPQRN